MSSGITDYCPVAGRETPIDYLRLAVEGLAETVHVLHYRCLLYTRSCCIYPKDRGLRDDDVRNPRTRTTLAKRFPRESRMRRCFRSVIIQ